ETHVMSLEVRLPGNAAAPGGVVLPGPILSQGEFADLAAQFGPVHTTNFTFPANTGVPGARSAIAQCLSTPLARDAPPRLFLLSGRGLAQDRAGLPALLAAAAFWRVMVHEGLFDVPLVVETAQAFDTHHVALLVAAGASAVVPYLTEQFSETEEPGGFSKVR